MKLKEQLLASLENHGLCELNGLYDLYPHYNKLSILRALCELRKEGWVTIRRIGHPTRTFNVRRSKRKMYNQLALI